MTLTSARDRNLTKAWWSVLSSLIPSGVSGIWFGLTELMVEGEAVTTLYVTGASAFDLHDVAGDWASDPVWWPGDPYVTIPGLSAIPPTDWRHALDYATELIEFAIKPIELPSSVKGVGLGWDDGDVRILWTRP